MDLCFYVTGWKYFYAKSHFVATNEMCMCMSRHAILTLFFYAKQIKLNVHSSFLRHSFNLWIFL